MIRAFGYVLLSEAEYQQLLVMRIVRTPGILGGEPCIAGTRISVRDVVEYVRIYDRDIRACPRRATRPVGGRHHSGDGLLRCTPGRD